MLVPGVPNPYDDDTQRTQRLESQLDESPRRQVILFACGLLSLVAFGVLALLGLPGSGLVLVPIGILLIIGGGIPFVLHRLSA